MNDLSGPTGSSVAWDEFAPCEHLVQFYDSKAALFDMLDDFVATGIAAGEATVVIALNEHLAGLDARMRQRSVDLVAARWRGLYIPIDATDLLAQFMINGLPDEQAFRTRIKTILDLARQNGRKVRAFGEMVAILWSEGRHEALLKLEDLWNAVCREESVKLFCAYPRPGDGVHEAHTHREICAAHSHVLGNTSPRRLAAA